MPDETQSFVVRIWHEAADGQGQADTWRGSIDHVGANKRLYFAELDAVVRFIQERTGLVSRARSPWAALRASVQSFLARRQGR